jgi:hypothetical protein
MKHRKATLLLASLAFCLSGAFSEGIGDTDNWYELDNLSTIAAGSMVAVESGLLLIGMNIPKRSDWSTFANNSMAITDVLMGSALVYYGFSGEDYSKNAIYYGIASLLLISHIYRDADYLNGKEHAFCANKALFAFNNIRMGLVGSSLLLTILY